MDPASTIRRRDGTEVVRRSLKMVDVSTSTINVTLWGQVAMKEGAQLQEMYHLQKSTVLVIKGGRLAEYNGRVVSTLATSQILVNLDIDEANQLQSWFSEHGHTFLATTPTLLDSPIILARKTITNIEEECSTSLKPLQYIVKATLVFVVRKKFCYPSCPLVIAGKQCKKRVEKNSDCKWYCPKCLTTFSDCDYRYVLQVKLEDHTGSLWATAFDETTTKLLCMPAKELYMLQFDDNEPDRAEFSIRTAQYNQFLFTITSKMEPYNDELHMNSTILEVARLDFISECTSLFDGIIALVLAATE